jgi:hypothetical protein
MALLRNDRDFWIDVESGGRDATRRVERLLQAIEDALRYANNMQHTNEWVVMKMKHVLECARDGKPRP